MKPKQPNTSAVSIILLLSERPKLCAILAFLSANALMHSERPKLHTILAFLSAVELSSVHMFYIASVKMGTGIIFSYI